MSEEAELLKTASSAQHSLHLEQEESIFTMSLNSQNKGLGRPAAAHWPLEPRVIEESWHDGARAFSCTIKAGLDQSRRVCS